MVREPRRGPTKLDATPFATQLMVTRKRVRACRPSKGVAAKAETWSPSSQRQSPGFPKPNAASISDRLRIASRSPVAANARRRSGGPY